MAVTFERILPLLLNLFLASTSLGQNTSLSEFTVTPPIKINDVPHEKFESRFYKNAQNYTEAHWREISVGEANDFSLFSTHLETRIRQKMAEFAGNPTLSVEEMSTIIQKKINDGSLTSAEISVLQAHTMATQEAYVKRVIEIFDLDPVDLDATPEIFCDVFGVCQSTPTTTLSTTSESTTPSLTTSTTTTITTTTTKTTTKEKTTTEEVKAESIPPTTTELKIEPVENESSTSTTKALPSSTLKPVISEETIVKETVDVTEEIENSDANIEDSSGPRYPSPRNDDVLIEIEDVLDTKTEKSVTPAVTPAVTPEKEEILVTTKTEPEAAESGWGSGASRTSHFTFSMLLCSLILILSNLL